MGIDFAGSATPFNMGMLYYQGLGALWDLKDKSYIEGDVFGYFLAIAAMYRKIRFKLSKCEAEAVAKGLEAARGIVKDLPPVLRESDRKRDFLGLQVVHDLEELDVSLVSHMAHYNMIFPKMAATGMEALNARYDLEGDKRG